MNQGLDILAIVLAIVAAIFVVVTIIMYFCYHTSGKSKEEEIVKTEGSVDEVIKYENKPKDSKSEEKAVYISNIKESSKAINPNFVIEKSLMFVSTDEVI